ncbi:MAG: hypothetical protein Q8Q12_12355 [bacterium]|nr:hypothetical protein [bacterium]
MTACSYTEDGPAIVAHAMGICRDCKSYLQQQMDQARDNIDVHSEPSMRAILRRVELSGRTLILVHRAVSALVQSSVFSVPSPVALMIGRLAKRIDQKATLVVVPLTGYDYHHQAFNLGPLGSSEVKGLSLLGLPSAHRQCPFGATLLFHELGHFAAHALGFNEKPPWRPRPLEEPHLYARIYELAQLRVGKGPMDVQSEMSTLLRVRDRWCQELFADHFALAVAGPVYLGAFCALENVMPSPSGPLHGVLPTHPHSYTRIRYMLRGLNLENATILAERMPRTHSAAKDLSGLPSPSDYVELEEAFGLDEWFDPVTKRADELVRKWEMSFDSRLFSEEHASPVLDRFAHLTPAGQLVGTDGSVSYPDWRAVLNAAWLFLTEKRDLWDDKLLQEGSQLERHCAAVDKLSALVMKSLEDIMVAKEWPEANHVRIE